MAPAVDERQRPRATKRRKTSAASVDDEPRRTTPSRIESDTESLSPLEWRDLCSTTELSCATTLTSGQVFTWHQDTATKDWVGVVQDYIFRLREREQRVQFQCVYPPNVSDTDAHAVLVDYFRLEVLASPLYKQWSEPDDRMSKIIRSLPGLRIIRQDPVECLFAFICSSNNNIQRITQMITKLKTTYGTFLWEDPRTKQPYYAFPTPDVLAETAEESVLRSLGFGYRAPFIIKSSQLLVSLGGREYLMRLRDKSPASDDSSSVADDQYAEKLMVFAGVGRKVADCIGLFSLDKLHAIPVDTHVWQIACREFDASLKTKKSITPTVYRAVGDHFRRRFSPFAGWAHSVLFTGDLSVFQTQLPADLQHRKRGAAKKNAKSATRVISSSD
ncbi:hypothetical protein ATCC90586_009175 [Pythium insidiosum]|nr:hypothetical protein ATCC90586_009175 [Pythium insidiosum]